MSLSSQRRRAQARADKHASMHVVQSPGGRIADVWFRPGAFTDEQVARYLNGASRVVRAEIREGGLALEIKPDGYRVLREHASKHGIEATCREYGVSPEDIPAPE